MLLYPAHNLGKKMDGANPWLQKQKDISCLGIVKGFCVLLFSEYENKKKKNEKKYNLSTLF